MNICILYHSQTGITETFAKVIEESLRLAGHMVETIKLSTKNPVKQSSIRDKQVIEITNLPKSQSYDIMLFGGPVWAFGPSPVIVTAIQTYAHLRDMKCIPFVTMGFPFQCLGGNAAIRYMSRELRTKGAQVMPGFICTRAHKDIQASMRKLSEEILQAIK